MTIQEFNKTRFEAGMTMLLTKSNEVKLIVSVDFDEALLAYLIDDYNDTSITWVRCENCKLL
jgi:hypothetical protein